MGAMSPTSTTLCAERCAWGRHSRNPGMKTVGYQDVSLQGSGEVPKRHRVPRVVSRPLNGHESITLPSRRDYTTPSTAPLWVPRPWHSQTLQCCQPEARPALQRFQVIGPQVPAGSFAAKQHVCPVHRRGDQYSHKICVCHPAYSSCEPVTVERGPPY